MNFRTHGFPIHVEFIAPLILPGLLKPLCSSKEKNAETGDEDIPTPETQRKKDGSIPGDGVVDHGTVVQRVRLFSTPASRAVPALATTGASAIEVSNRATSLE